jgi:PhnB protein
MEKAMNAKTSATRQTVRVHMTVHDAKAAIDFYASAFGAVDAFRLVEPGNGKVGHAEIQIGDSVLMLNDEYPGFGARSPAATGGSPVAFHISVEDADRAVDRAVTAGATLVRPVQNQFYGDRCGMVACPFGYRWSLAATKEVVSPADMQKRWSRMLEGGKVE